MKPFNKQFAFKLPGIFSFIRLDVHIYTTELGLVFRLQGKHLVTIPKEDIIEADKK